MIKLMIYCMILMSIISCREVVTENYNTRILNSKLVEAINLYVENNKIDVTSSIITLTPSDGESFIISNENSDMFKSDLLPTYYSTLDDCKVVFIYSERISAFSLVSKENILLELQQVFKKCNVTLKKYKLGMTYNPPVWKVWTCDNVLSVDDFTKSYELERLPYGYGVTQNSVNLDSLFIYRK